MRKPKVCAMLRRWAWRVARVLAAMGSIWVCAEWWTAQQGPLDGHPEGLRTDVPLSALERALRRDLREVWNVEPFYW
jgi:hypothetical protein